MRLRLFSKSNIVHAILLTSDNFTYGDILWFDFCVNSLFLGKSTDNILANLTEAIQARKFGTKGGR